MCNLNTVRYLNLCKEYMTLIVFIFFALIATIVSHLSVVDFFLFVGVQLFCIYIPGLAFLHLCKVDFEDTQIKKLVAYAIGYCMSIVLYLLLLIIGLQHLSRTISIGIAVVALILIRTQKRIVETPASQSDKTFVAIISALCFLIGLVIFQYTNQMPTESGVNVFVSQDLVFWFRNCVAATKSYPLPELSVAGKDFFYHYFTSVEIAWLHYVTDIEILDLCFTYSYLVNLFLLASGVFVLGKILIQDKILTYWAVSFILFTSSLEMLTHIFYSAHIFSVSFGFAEGLAISCLSVYFFIRWFRSGFASNRDAFFSVLLLMLCTGLKGPVASVVLSGYGVGCTIAIFQKGAFWKGVSVGLAYLLAFVLILGFFVFNHESSAEGSSSELSVSLIDTLFHSHIFEKLYLSIQSFIPPRSLVYLIVFILYVFSAMLIPLVLLLYALRKYTLFVSQNGMSQMYFMLVSILYLNLLNFSLLSKINFCPRIHYKFLCITFVLGFILFSVQIAPNGYRFAKIVLNAVPGINPKQNKMSESGWTISKAEIEGLRWVRDHVSEDAVILSNKVLEENGGARCFWVSSLTERQIYFESYDYSNLSENYIKDKKELVARFYNGDNEISSFLKKEGVAYAVVFKHLH